MFEESRCEMDEISDTIRNCINFKQKEQEKESFIDYTRRFKLSREFMMTHVGGPLLLNKYIRETCVPPCRGINAEKTLIDDADERLAAFVYLINSYQTKQGSIIEILNIQRSLKND